MVLTYITFKHFTELLGLKHFLFISRDFKMQSYQKLMFFLQKKTPFGIFPNGKCYHKGSQFESRSLSLWTLYVLPVYAWVLPGYSGFLPQS